MTHEQICLRGRHDGAFLGSDPLRMAKAAPQPPRMTPRYTATGSYDDGKAVRRVASLTIGEVAVGAERAAAGETGEEGVALVGGEVVPKRTSAWKTEEESLSLVGDELSAPGAGEAAGVEVTSAPRGLAAACGELGPAGTSLAPPVDGAAAAGAEAEADGDADADS